MSKRLDILIPAAIVLVAALQIGVVLFSHGVFSASPVDIVRTRADQYRDASVAGFEDGLRARDWDDTDRCYDELFACERDLYLEWRPRCGAASRLDSMERDLEACVAAAESQ